jgi:hypothetical protein
MSRWPRKTSRQKSNAESNIDALLAQAAEIMNRPDEFLTPVAEAELV